MFKLIYLLFFIFTIVSCHDSKKHELNLENLTKVCSQSNSIDEYEIIEPIIPETGIERKAPVNLVSRTEFIERLRSSELWSKLKYKFNENEDYTDTFIFEKSEGYIRILGEKDINNLTYGFNNAYKRNALGHKLNEHDKFEMQQTINLIINDIEASTKLLDELYSDYLYKLENNINHELR